MTGVSASRSSAPVFLPGAEAALVALSASTAVGFWRVFDGPSFLAPMLAVALVTHLVLILGRRRGWTVPVAALVSAPAAVMVCVWLVFPAATTAGVPTPETVREVVDALYDSWLQFSNILAPATPEPGFVVASCVALYFAVFLADWAAFRLWSSFESVVPATTLFLFCALLGAAYQVPCAALFITSLLAFLLLHRIARQESSSGWLVGEPTTSDDVAPAGRRGPVMLGASLVAIAVVAGTLVGPRLPGAGAPAVIPWRNNGHSSGERKETSPLVRIRDRLLEQTDVPLFTVQANNPSYWRLTSLDTFDGDIWRSQARFEDAEGDLPGDVGDGDTMLLQQRFTISNLDKIWAPAAYKPVKVPSASVGLSYNEESATLIVDSDDSLPGASYEVQSKLTKPTTDMLRTITMADIPRSIQEHYTKLPDDFSDQATRVAHQLGQGKTLPYDLARALQDFFRSGAFVYDTRFELGHGENAIDTFLQDKRGFCEQFAGTYAAMARALGLPARVAVGFTPGVVRNPNLPNVYEVTGRQTHAWPEVYLGRFGWVMFEPTPNRGAPNADWTDVPANQDVGAPVPPPSIPTGSAPPSSIGVGPVPPTEPPPETTTTTRPAPEPQTEVRRGWLSELFVHALPALAAVVVIVAGLAGAVALYVAVLGSLRDRRRRERRAWATDASRRVQVAWEECLEELRTIGLVPRPAESHDEFAQRVAPLLGDAGPDLLVLAEATNHAEFARDLLPDEVADQAVATAAVVERTAGLQRTPAQLWMSRLDPRPLLDDGRPRPHHTISVRSPSL